MALDDSKIIVDAVIFDLDGTLIDSTEVYFRILEVAFERLEISPVSTRDVLDAAKDGDFDWDRVLPNKPRGQQDELVIKARTIIQDIAPEMFRQDVNLIPGAGEILKEISTAGIKIGLVTSTPRKYLGEKLYPLRRSGIENLFRVIITTDDVPRKKPAADPLIECGKRLGVGMDKAVYVGDTRTDIRAGKAAGMKTIGVLTGFEDCKSLKKENPDAIIGSVVDLTEKIAFNC